MAQTVLSLRVILNRDEHRRTLPILPAGQPVAMDILWGSFSPNEASMDVALRGSPVAVGRAVEFLHEHGCETRPLGPARRAERNGLVMLAKKILCL